MSEPNDQRLDVLQGWLLLLPFLGLCLPAPWSLFAGAPDTISIGAGWTALGVLPALILSTVRAVASRESASRAAAIPLGTPFLLVPIALGAYQLRDSSDAFNAWRALMGLCAGAGVFMVASSLGAAGRQVLQRGLPLGSLLLLGAALLDGAGRDHSGWPVGPIGNTGDLVEAALPAALIGAGAFLSAGGILGLLSLGALLCTAIYTGATPVYAGLAALAACALLTFAASALGRSGAEEGRTAAARRARLLLVALLLAVVATLVRQAAGSGSEAEPTDGAAVQTPDDASGELDTTGGFEFRRLTWARIPDALAATGAEGAGPGQFQAAFPPFRDPAEIELSSRNRAEPTPQEVEHAHNDLATALVEYGWIGGGALGLLMVLLLVQALRSLAGDEPTRRDFAIASIGTMTLALFNSPLLYAPLSHYVAFLSLGIVAAPRLGSQREHGKAGLGAQAIVLAAVLLMAPRAVDMVRYGRAMATIDDARIVTPDGREGLDPVKLTAILDRALEAAPESYTALEKKAELLRMTGADPLKQIALHGDLVGLRPHSVAGRLNLGTVLGRSGQFDKAFESLEAGIQLDPGNPQLLRTLIRVTFDDRSTSGFGTMLDRAMERIGLEDDFLRQYAEEALVGCRLDLAQIAVDRYRGQTGRPRIQVSDLNALSAASKAWAREDNEPMRIAYRTAFNYLVALDHMRNGAPETAARMARQAYQRARNAGVDSSAARLRLAAAEAAAGRLDDARAHLDEAPLRRSDVDALSSEERTALESAGLIQARAPLRGASIGPR